MGFSWSYLIHKNQKQVQFWMFWISPMNEYNEIIKKKHSNCCLKPYLDSFWCKSALEKTIYSKHLKITQKVKASQQMKTTPKGRHLEIWSITVTVNPWVNLPYLEVSKVAIELLTLAVWTTLFFVDSNCRPWQFHGHMLKLPTLAVSWPVFNTLGALILKLPAFAVSWPLFSPYQKWPWNCYGRHRVG